MLRFLRTGRAIAGLSMALLSSAALVRPAGAAVYGLDVYNGNGAMNWPLIAGGGKDFAFVKATEGTGLTDARLATNESQGTAAGLLMGCYDFARPDLNTAVSEADYYVQKVQAVGGFAAGKLKPMLDFEHTGNTGSTTPSAWANAWCTEVKRLTGLDSIIYTYPSFASSYLNSTVTTHPLFIASYDHNDPSVKTSVTGPWNGKYSFWQYSSTGKLAGDPSGNVDLDLYNGNLASLVANFAIGGVKPAFAPSATVPEPALGTAILGASFALLGRRRRSCSAR